jgi:Peptidase_C39 like family
MRLILFLLICSIVFPVSAFATAKASPLSMSRDMHQILVGQSQIIPDTLTGVAMIRDKYLHDVSLFAKRYIGYPIQTILLTPTVDRSLVYRLMIQQYRLSCEIAALRILLDRLDIRVTESEIFAHIRQYPYVYSGGIWGDPDREFVGYYTGGQTRQTGYGVYQQPLADYAQALGLHTEIIDLDDHTGTLIPRTHMTRLLTLLDQKDSHIMLW